MVEQPMMPMSNIGQLNQIQMNSSNLLLNKPTTPPLASFRLGTQQNPEVADECHNNLKPFSFDHDFNCNM